MSQIWDDAEGFLWTDVAYVRRGGGGPKQDPIGALKARLMNMSFPDEYKTPPLLTPPSGVMAFDTETLDPDLMEIGSSSVLGRGEVLGFSVAWEGYKAYFSLRHITGNVDEVPVLRWLRDQVKREDLKFVMANANYDMAWIYRETGMYPRGGAVDVQHMAALLDEYSLSYSLETIAQRYLKKGKTTNRLKEIETRTGAAHTTMMACLKWLPGPVVASYAEDDAEVTLEVYNKMLPQIHCEGLTKVFEVECELIPMTTEMRRIGTRVDTAAAEQLKDELDRVKMPAIKAEIKRLTGVDVNPWVAEDCHDALAAVGVTGFTKTPKGDGWSIKAEFLNKLAPHVPVAALILELRKIDKISGTFLEGHILSHQVNGRVHTNFNQLRSERDEGGFGTVTGRLSSNGPNLQQLPIRDPYWGPLIRSMFIPEDGEEFVSIDYSSQEPRMAVHFAYKANIPGAEEAVARFRKNPKTDYHGMVAEMAHIPRGPAKTLNLGLGYGMGQAKMCRALGLPTQWMLLVPKNGKTEWHKIEIHEVSHYRSRGFSCVEVAGEEGKKILEAWEQGAPFVKGLFKESLRIAEKYGFIMTLLRRKCRFPSIMGEYQHCYKAMNKLCQSSSADQMKQAMVYLHREKIISNITIHDELLTSMPRGHKNASRMAEIMENAIPLVIPTVVDVKWGKSWGQIEK